MAVAKYKYVMDYIDDPDTYKAVMYCCKLLKWGKSFHQAVRIASKEYGVDMVEIRHYVSQRSARINKEA